MSRAGTRRRRSQRRREWISNEKAKMGCAICGEDCPDCLDFHGLRGKSHVSEMVARGVSKKRIEAEMEKCICVCSNCHRKIHVGLIAIEGDDPWLQVEYEDISKETIDRLGGDECIIPKYKRGPYNSDIYRVR